MCTLPLLRAKPCKCQSYCCTAYTLSQEMLALTVCCCYCSFYLMWSKCPMTTLPSPQSKPCKRSMLKVTVLVFSGVSSSELILLYLLESTLNTYYGFCTYAISLSCHHGVKSPPTAPSELRAPCHPALSHMYDSCYMSADDLRRLNMHLACIAWLYVGLTSRLRVLATPCTLLFRQV